MLAKYLKLLLRSLGLYLIVEPDEFFSEDEIQAAVKLLELAKRKYNYNKKGGE